MYNSRSIFSILVIFLLSGCVGKPDKVEPVTGFELQRYLGEWHEIARLDHSFERGLSKVTANYSLRDDGGVKVINRGYDAQNKKWKEAEGKAYFVNSADEAYLKVSFFGPFYGAYIVFELDHAQYQYALVSGPDTSYFWILARTPVISSELQQRLVQQAALRGFDTDQLIWPDQD
jgi:apolipoprotein D and lipocalin family protein